MFQAGTSEIKNWIAVAGAMSESDLPMTLVDYVPCYRSEAGTGSGMGFATWGRPCPARNQISLPHGRSGPAPLAKRSLRLASLLFLHPSPKELLEEALL